MSTDIVKQTVNLGFIINSRLDADDHIDLTTTQIQNILRKLCFSSSYVSIRLVVPLVYASLYLQPFASIPLSEYNKLVLVRGGKKLVEKQFNMY